MALLNIDFSYDDNVKNSIRKAKNALQTRISDYTGIKKNLNNISSSTGNLSNANTYIQKKITILESKCNKLDSFYNAVNTFNDNAETADRRVANRINTETKQFYKRENIKTGIIYSIGSVIGEGTKWLKGVAEDIVKTVIDKVSAAWVAIKKWYEDNKYWINIVVDVVCVASAVFAMFASGSIVALLFAGWGLLNSMTEFAYDSAALGAAKGGNEELADKLSEGSMKDVMEQYDAEWLYYGIETASLIYNLYGIGKSASQIFKDYKTFNAPFQDNIASVTLSDATKKQIIKTDIKNTVLEILGVESLDSATGQLKAKNIYKDVKFAWKLGHNFVTSDNAGGVLKTIKVISQIDNIITNVKKITEKAFSNAGNYSPAAT